MNVSCVFYLFLKSGNTHTELVIHTTHVHMYTTSMKLFIISSLNKVECCVFLPNKSEMSCLLYFNSYFSWHFFLSVKDLCKVLSCLSLFWKNQITSPSQSKLKQTEYTTCYLADEKLDMSWQCTCSPESQPYPKLHKKEHDQQVQGVNSALPFCFGETHLE